MIMKGVIFLSVHTSDICRFFPNNLNKSTCKSLKYQFTVETKGLITGRPLLHKKQIFVYDSSGSVFSLGFSNNQIFWKSQFDDAFIFNGLADDEGITLGGKALYRIRRRDGEVVWKVPTSSDNSSRLCAPIVSVGSRLLILNKTDTGEYLSMFDKERGGLFQKIRLSEIWDDTPLNLCEKQVIDLAANAHIVTVSTIYGLLCFRTFDLKLLWKIKMPLSSPPTIYYPEAQGSAIAVGDPDGNICTLSVHDPQSLTYKKVLDEAVTFRIIPAVGVLYCCGNTQLASYSPKTGDILWKQTNIEITTSGFDIYTNICGVGDMLGNMTYYDLLSGEVCGITHYRNAPVSSRCAAAGNYIYFGLGTVASPPKTAGTPGLTCFSIY